jgi:hypothetical protein
LICLAFFIICSSADLVDSDYSYDDFMRQFNRTYIGQEKEDHRLIFEFNYADLMSQNEAGANLIVN